MNTANPFISRQGDCFLAACGSDEWNPHPVCPGVRLKTLVSGADSSGATKVFLVRLEPEAVIAAHKHPKEWEIHAVTSGTGHCICGDENKVYFPGSTALMPMGVEHEVRAGTEGLIMLAFFSAAG